MPKITLELEVDEEPQIILFDRNPRDQRDLDYTAEMADKGYGRTDCAMVNVWYKYRGVTLEGANHPQHLAWFEPDGTLKGDAVPFLTEEHKAELADIYRRLVETTQTHPQYAFMYKGSDRLGR